MAKATKKYKLIGRDHDGFDENGERKRFETGDMVPLTDTQYEAFKDKFEDPKSKNDEDKVESPTKPESNTDPDTKNVQPAPGTQNNQQVKPQGQAQTLPPGAGTKQA